MHWWQIAIRLVLIANCLGNWRGAIRAGRERDWDRLHWLVPKTIGWTMLFLAMLPARYGGIGTQHWDTVAGMSLVLLLYGMLIEKTDSSFPPFPSVLVEIPHLGSISLQFIPHLIVASSLFLAVAAVWDGIHLHRVTIDDKVFLVASSVGLLFGIRLCLRQYYLSRFADLIEFAKIKPRPPETPTQHDWLKPDGHSGQ